MSRHVIHVVLYICRPEDEETILAVQQSKGRPLAILVLLCTVVKRRESWFPCLMMAMKDQGRYRHIVEQIDADILSAGKTKLIAGLFS